MNVLCTIITFIVFGCAVHLKIEEIGRMLRTGDLGIPTNPTERYANLFTSSWLGCPLANQSCQKDLENFHHKEFY